MKQIQNSKLEPLLPVILSTLSSYSEQNHRHPEQSEESSVTTCRDSSPFAQNNRKINSYKDLITFVENRAGYDRRYTIDATKLENELGWRADENFDSGIVKTIEWYLNNKEIKNV